MARWLDGRDYDAIGAIPEAAVAPDPIRRTGLAAIEWPTVAMLAACYGAWLAALAIAAWAPGAWSIVALVCLAGPAVGLHASLQHEALHGHPTRSATWNEALVFVSLNLCMPYRRFKALHLRHHHDERLTDPYDDPESYYVAEGDWSRLSPPLRALLRANQTLLGRLTIGPWLSIFGFWRSDLREALTSPRAGRVIADAYGRHLIGVALALTIVWGGFGIAPHVYLMAAAWPGLAFLLLRGFAEHRAAEAVGERTAVIEAEAPLALMFLNNNLHAAHHRHPRLPWYALPEVWRRDRASFLEENGGYLIRGYRELFRRWLLRAKEPLAHPYLRRARDEAQR